MRYALGVRPENGLGQIAIGRLRTTAVAQTAGYTKIRTAASGRLPTHTILDPLTAFRSAAVGHPRTVTSPAKGPLTAGGFRSRSALEKGRHRQRRPVIDCCRQILGTRRRGLLRNSDVVTKGSPCCWRRSDRDEAAHCRQRARLSLLAWIRIAGIWLRLHGGYTDPSIPMTCGWNSPSP